MKVQVEPSRAQIRAVYAVWERVPEPATLPQEDQYFATWELISYDDQLGKLHGRLARLHQERSKIARARALGKP
jgi:hypothetical protein